MSNCWQSGSWPDFSPHAALFYKNILSWGLRLKTWDHALSHPSATHQDSCIMVLLDSRQLWTSHSRSTHWQNPKLSAAPLSHAHDFNVLGKIKKGCWEWRARKGLWHSVQSDLLPIITDLCKAWLCPIQLLLQSRPHSTPESQSAHFNNQWSSSKALNWKSHHPGAIPLTESRPELHVPLTPLNLP